MLSLVHHSPFRRVLFVFVLLLSGSISAVRASTPTPTPTPGRLDTTFVPAPGTNDAVNVVIPQPDGKVIAAGRFTFANNVARNRI
ncbi:MAG TPA: delta-60 repeat domain-containing protein, partial [Verrucomicrobiae bacterium]|nr:delta-60 repeat domain-containing protein [Verrucomicrobiae bacterium]